jgi:PST family polysaccharide transporter
MATQLVRGKLAALLLGPAGVGVYNQLSLTWNLFQIGGSLGSANGVIQHGAEALAAKDQQALRRLASTAFILLAATAMLLAALGILAAPWLSELLLNDQGDHAALLQLILLSVPLGVSAQVYRGLLSAGRQVRALVRVQIASDVGGAVVFALLIVRLGLAGAILGFMTTHLFALILAYFKAREALGAAAIRPRVGAFDWKVVRSNVGFGASGLVMIALGNLSILLVSRLVIGHLGIEANGIFANAWRIASVYLGAVTATAFSYYLPTITACETAKELSNEVNRTLRFYLYVLPLLMAGILAFAEPIVWLILSRQFLAVALLLLVFVPAELMRIMAETLSMPLLARRQVKLFTLNYLVTAGAFVGMAAWLLPIFGLDGAALAYGASNIVYFVIAGALIRRRLGVTIEGKTIGALVAALILLGALTAICLTMPFAIPRLALAAACGTLWLAVVLRNHKLRHLLRLPARQSTLPPIDLQ